MLLPLLKGNNLFIYIASVCCPIAVRFVPQHYQLPTTHSSTQQSSQTIKPWSSDIPTRSFMPYSIAHAHLPCKIPCYIQIGSTYRPFQPYVNTSAPGRALYCQPRVQRRSAILLRRPCRTSTFELYLEPCLPFAHISPWQSSSLSAPGAATLIKTNTPSMQSLHC